MRWLLACGLALVALPGCTSTSRNVWALGLPGTRTPFVVSTVDRRGDFLDVMLQGGGFDVRSFAPADGDCLQVLEPEARIEWLASGMQGRLERNGRVCDSAGIGSLLQWRNRGPRPRQVRQSVVPRAPAHYEVVFTDDQVALLRGRFPLAGLLGWAGGDDTIAVIPNSELCAPALERTTSSMQYFPAGRRVLTLVVSNGQCPIEGLIRPLSEAQPTEAASGAPEGPGPEAAQGGAADTR